MDIISYKKIRDFYNKHNNCWANDLFSQMTTNFIDDYVNKIIRNLDEKSVILNAGSGGKKYDTLLQQFHLDIAENTLTNVKNAFVGNIVDMPFDDNSFDCVICVGTVINYCEIERAIEEIKRVSKDDSILILEYERSGSGLLPKRTRNQESIVFYHNYFNEEHSNLLYSDIYVKRALNKYGFIVKKHKRFNTVIPFFERFLSEKTAHRLVFLEPLFRSIPIINLYSHNEIMICKNT